MKIQAFFKVTAAFVAVMFIGFMTTPSNLSAVEEDVSGVNSTWRSIGSVGEDGEDGGDGAYGNGGLGGNGATGSTPAQAGGTGTNGTDGGHGGASSDGGDVTWNIFGTVHNNLSIMLDGTKESFGSPGVNGIDGVDGAKGADGANGADGADGADGDFGDSDGLPGENGDPATSPGPDITAITPTSSSFTNNDSFNLYSRPGRSGDGGNGGDGGSGGDGGDGNATFPIGGNGGLKGTHGQGGLPGASGEQGTLELRVKDGGIFNNNGNVQVLPDKGTNKLVVESGGTFNNNEDVIIRGATLINDGTWTGSGRVFGWGLGETPTTPLTFTNSGTFKPGNSAGIHIIGVDDYFGTNFLSHYTEAGTLAIDINGTNGLLGTNPDSIVADPGSYTPDYDFVVVSGNVDINNIVGVLEIATSYATVSGLTPGDTFDIVRYKGDFFG